MNDDGATMSAMVTTQKAIRLRMIFPLSFLVLTCCMAQVEAGARQQPEETGKSTVAAAAAEQLQGMSHSTTSTELSISTGMNEDAGTKVAADAVEEGRRILSEKPSESKAKKSKEKGKPPAKRLDASAEEEEEEEDEEEEEEDEEADDEVTTGKGSAKGGVATGSRLKSIQSDFDPALRADLVEATVRGSVLSVAVSLTFRGNKDRNEIVVKELGYCSGNNTWVTDYESGNKFGCKTVSGFDSGQIKNGETKTLRLTFPAPKGAKTVGITLYNLGTFDDVKLGSSGGSASGKPKDTSKTEDIEEEDEEDEEDDSKGLTIKKGAKKGAKK